MQIIKIAFRNIIKDYRRTLLLSGTLAFSFVMIILVSAFFRGMGIVAEQNGANILGGHLLITGRERTESGQTINLIADTEKLHKALESVSDEIVKHTIRNPQPVQFIVGSKLQYKELTGMDFANETEFLQQLHWVQGSLEDVLADEKGLFLFADIAEELGAQLGEIVTVQATTITGQDNLMNFVLRGVVEVKNLSLRSYASAGYSHLRTVDNLSAVPEGKYTKYILKLRNPDKRMLLRGSLMNQLKKTVTYNREVNHTPPEDWEDLKESIEESDKRIAERFKLEEKYMLSNSRYSYKNQEMWEGTSFQIVGQSFGSAEFNGMNHILSFAIFIILLIITMVGITNSYHMVMLERKSEIGIMRAMGAQRNTIRILFRLEAIFISLISIITGLVIVLVITKIIEVIPFPQSNIWGNAMMNGHLLLPISPTIVGITALLVFGATLVAIANPSEQAAKLEPVQALTST